MYCFFIGTYLLLGKTRSYIAITSQQHCVTAKERYGSTHYHSSIGENTLACLYFSKPITSVLGDARPRMKRRSTDSMKRGECGVQIRVQWQAYSNSFIWWVIIWRLCKTWGCGARQPLVATLSITAVNSQIIQIIQNICFSKKSWPQESKQLRSYKNKWTTWF